MQNKHSNFSFSLWIHFNILLWKLFPPEGTSEGKVFWALLTDVNKIWLSCSQKEGTKKRHVEAAFLKEKMRVLCVKSYSYDTRKGVVISFWLLSIAANAAVMKKVVFGCFFFFVVLCMCDERESEHFWMFVAEEKRCELCRITLVLSECCSTAANL